jgi:hypothetical protein
LNGAVTYLSIGDSTVSVFVDLFNKLMHLFVADVETSGLDQSSEFFSADSAIIIKVAADESLVKVEAGSLIKSLSKVL